MSSDYAPDGWTPGSDDLDDVAPQTEPKGELIPPPRKPPTAVAADAAEPEPRPPRSVQRWKRPTRGPVPKAIVRAVDAVLDVLDSVGDAVRAAAGRAMS